MATNTLEETVASAKDLPPEQAISKLRDVILGKHPNDAESIKAKEQAIQRLSNVYAKREDAEALRKLLTELRPLFGAITKAKTAKIVRNVIETIAKVPNSTQLQMEVCTEQVDWAKAEKRTFLRQRIEARLANLYLSNKDYSSALSLISRLLTEVKRLDDKLLLLDIHLLESRTHHALKNLPKAKAALTASRTAANAIYVPPSSQAEIDMQSGTLHAEEKDYKTAYSYFFEAFEALSSLDDPKATLALKYMLLSKVMMKDADEVPGLVSSKAGLKHAGQDVDSMVAVAKAYKDRSLQGFQDALALHKEQLVDDPIVHAHLSELYDTLLEGNLARLIEPFSCVEISHLAQLIKLPQDLVLDKLSQMILDKKFAGTLDQGAGCLEVFEDGAKDGVYPAALDTFSNMGRVIDSLFLRSQKIMA
ncbi:g624 [Coccomyxa viridis]|uniref:G624 protein n=1 Tax=Coccomyxa viridis TaxID=1274662 RepID=A0ABP1FJ42_9CHLO